MADIYKNLEVLLQERGISGAKLCAELGMSRSFLTELKMGRAKSIKLETAKKIADYLGVSPSRLLGEETETPLPGGKRSVTDEDIKFALFGGDGEITDEMYEEVKRFAAYLKAKQAQEQD
ncbi:MAG: helix-turn-helix domain-containing protein [Oscillospiraceae bacterium]|nr:helix-turn-helix domain-containing protein [Oscillospiraceae bacterium]